MGSKSFIFSTEALINTPLRVFFLCGSHYVNNREDKRKIFRQYIENQNNMFKALILEDHFCFRRDDKLLNYNEINMKSLKDIELLTGLFAEKIFILHECISTAAELGLFSGNKYISDKIILLTPDQYSVEEEFLSGFISLAFNNKVFTDYNVDNIFYYPGIKKISISENKKKYHTYFINNEIPCNLKSQISARLAPIMNPVRVKLLPSKLFQQKRSTNIYYKIDDATSLIYLDPNILSGLLISLFNIDFIRNELRKSRSKFNFINKLWKYLEDIMLNTIRHETGEKQVINKLKFILTGIEMDPKQAVSYFVYILMALDLIEESSDKDSKFTIKMEFKDVYVNYRSMLRELTSSKIKEVLDI
ncbi:Uncharacterised protein [Bacillus freudenreichii]|nr:Uncharacterised protein [Bacillus freudenreichii]